MLEIEEWKIMETVERDALSWICRSNFLILARIFVSIVISNVVTFKIRFNCVPELTEWKETYSRPVINFLRLWVIPRN